MSDFAPIGAWPQRIKQAIAEGCKFFKRITVLRETGSTQDAARRMAAKPGDVITAWRQTAGRGRLGRAWADTFEEGVAVTLVANRREGEFIAIAAAIAVARAIEKVSNIPTRIKWPNDVHIHGRKVAGVLIEQVDQAALIGVGVNVNQTNWPDELNGLAISLAQAGKSVDRLDVLAELIVMMDQCLFASTEELNREFAARDILTGGQAAFCSGGREVRGHVLSVDPMRGIEVRDSHGAIIHLPAAITTVMNVQAGGSSPVALATQIS